MTLHTTYYAHDIFATLSRFLKTQFLGSYFILIKAKTIFFGAEEYCFNSGKILKYSDRTIKLQNNLTLMIGIPFC